MPTSSTLQNIRTSPLNPIVAYEPKIPSDSSKTPSSPIQPGSFKSGEDIDRNAASVPKAQLPTGYGTSYTSFGQVDDELSGKIVASPQPAEPEDSPPASPPAVVSPAAAFLSSFSFSTYTPPAPDATGLEVAGYTLGATIGYGGFSTVKEASSSSRGIVAVKIVRNTAFDSLPDEERDRLRTKFSHEERIWTTLSHENILPLFQVHHSPEATYLFTLYCPAGSLFDILKRDGRPALEQTDAGCMFRQVVKALQYMHDTMGLVHGDVKLENVLVDESGVCRLSDFGLTRRIGGTPCSSDEEQERKGECSDPRPRVPPKATRDRSRGRRSGTAVLPVHLSLRRKGQSRHRNSAPTPATDMPPSHLDHTFLPGSLPYAAPELLLPRTDVLSGRGTRYLPNPAQDMWALGVLLYTLLTGTYPFKDSFEPRLQMKILRGMYDVPSGIGPHAESVLKGCLELDVRKRWPISMVDDAAWGIGYGDVDLEPSISEEQRSQSMSRRSRSPPLGRTADDDEAVDAMSASIDSLSFGGSVCMSNSRSRSRGGKRSPSRGPWNQERTIPNEFPAHTRLHVRGSSSRSPSSPRTPPDERVASPSYFIEQEPEEPERSTKRVRVVVDDDSERGPQSLGVPLEEADEEEGDVRGRSRPTPAKPVARPEVTRLKSRSRSRSFNL